MSAQSGVSVMLSLFLATPSLIKLAAVRGTKCASVVQLMHIRSAPSTDRMNKQFDNGHVGVCYRVGSSTG